MYKYPLISDYVLPIGYIYGLYQSKYYLDLTSNFVIKSFWKFLLNSYIEAYTISYNFSLITFIIGFPTINLFFNIGINKLKRYIHNNDLTKIIDIMLKMIESLKNNKNWDVIYKGISIKTWSTPKPIESDKLESLCPLKYSVNPSNSKFLGICNICYDEINIKKLHRELPCMHVFHPECVDTWLLKCNGTCPICRQNIYVNQGNNDSINDKKIE